MWVIHKHFDTILVYKSSRFVLSMTISKVPSFHLVSNCQWRNRRGQSAPSPDFLPGNFWQLIGKNEARKKGNKWETLRKNGIKEGWKLGFFFFCFSLLEPVAFTLEPVKLFRGVPKWKLSPGKGLKSRREKWLHAGKNPNTPPKNFPVTPLRVV